MIAKEIGTINTLLQAHMMNADVWTSFKFGKTTSKKRDQNNILSN